MAERVRFAVLPGEGQPGPRAAAPGLVAVSPAHTPDQIPLGLWALAPSARFVISVGFQGLDVARFRQLLATFNVRHIVDIRALPAFRSRGFQPETIMRILDEVHVSYEQVRLANVFESRTRNPHLARDYYERFLRDECSAILAGIAQRAEAAPLMLLGSGADHFGEERELLARHISNFTSLQVIAHEGSAPSWKLSPYVLAGPEPATSAASSPKGRRSEQQTRSQQLVLFDAATSRRGRR